LGRWPEAEAEYRKVLEAVPEDVDMMVALAAVLGWQTRFDEALTVLERARTLQPRNVEVLVTRGRMLRSLGRTDEARESFRQALDLEPQNPEARQGIDSVQEEPRHQLVLGQEFSAFNFTSQEAQSYYLSLRSHISSRWVSVVGTQFDNRFGAQAGRFLGSLSYRLGRRDTLTAGGSAARDQGIIPKGEAFLEYGRGITLSRDRFLRGIELNVQQRWLWFDAARVLTSTGGFLLYFPRDWTWSVAVTAARSRFAGAGVEWQPSGITRLSFPLGSRVVGNTFFAVGTENFALADQLGRFSARTFGGGLRVRLTRRQDISGFFAYQDRSQQRTQKSFGIAYGIRF
jgi:YaiO family outer membrane protein